MIDHAFISIIIISFLLFSQLIVSFYFGLFILLSYCLMLMWEMKQNIMHIVLQNKNLRNMNTTLCTYAVIALQHLAVQTAG